jgi:hypothetical protein
MKRFPAVTAVLVLCSCFLSAADKPSLDGFWWAQMSPDYKLGWVSGYAQAMDLAGMLQTATCAAELPMYKKEFPNLDTKDILQKMCLSNTEFDYDGITMGQFVEGMDTFFKDYRNKQLEVGSAIQYVRDEIKGKPAQELDAEVTAWRRCSAATKTGDTAHITKACTPDATPKKQ